MLFDVAKCCLRMLHQQSLDAAQSQPLSAEDPRQAAGLHGLLTLKIAGVPSPCRG